MTTTLSTTGKGASDQKEKSSKLKPILATLKQDLVKVNRLIVIARIAKMLDFKLASTSPATSKLSKFSPIIVGKQKGGRITSMLMFITLAAKKTEIYWFC